MATLIAPTQHSPVEDAEALYSACKGWGADEKAIISILGHRTSEQKQQICIAYKNLYHEDLAKRLDSELSGDFKKAVHLSILGAADRDALLANEAIKQVNPDYHVIIEIACIRSPEELFEVRRAYHVCYKRSLEEDVAAHTTGDIRKLLVALVSAFRYDGDDINEKLAKAEADILHEAIKDKIFNHEDVIRIISTRSKAQLIATFNSYRDDHHGTRITKNLKDEGNQADEFSAALRTAIRCIKNSNKYFEKVVRNAMKGHGTDEDSFNRVIVGRAEKDLKNIKELYYNRNSVTLEQAVANDTSGDYKAFLLTLLGKQD